MGPLASLVFSSDNRFADCITFVLMLLLVLTSGSEVVMHHYRPSFTAERMRRPTWCFDVVVGGINLMHPFFCPSSPATCFVFFKASDKSPSLVWADLIWVMKITKTLIKKCSKYKSFLYYSPLTKDQSIIASLPPIRGHETSKKLKDLSGVSPHSIGVNWGMNPQSSQMSVQTEIPVSRPVMVFIARWLRAEQ